MLLTAEQNLIKFLSWALGELYPYGKFSNKTDNEGADSYHPGMYMWKKLNLSGRLEPPLLVEEPKYVIVRREFDQIDDNDYKRGKWREILINSYKTKNVAFHVLKYYKFSIMYCLYKLQITCNFITFYINFYYYNRDGNRTDCFSI